MEPQSIAIVLALAVHLVACETLAGMLVFRHSVIGPALELIAVSDGSASALDGWCRRVALACLAIMAGSALIHLGATTASVTGTDAVVDFAPDALKTLLRHTQFGLVWLLRMALILVLAMLIWLRPTSRNLAEENLPWAGLLLLTIALTGHAGAAVGAHHGVVLTLVGVHLAATAAWIGSLPPLVRLLADAESGGEMGGANLVREVVRRYGLYGGAAVGLLAASGVATAWLMLNGDLTRLRSEFGEVLAIKMVPFAVMIGLAFINRFIFSPRILARSQTVRACGGMWRIVLLEYAVGTFVLLAAAILSQTPPGH